MSPDEVLTRASQPTRSGHEVVEGGDAQAADLLVGCDGVDSWTRRELGLPCTPLEDSIERSVRYFREQGMV